MPQENVQVSIYGSWIYKDYAKQAGFSRDIMNLGASRCFSESRPHGKVSLLIL